MSEVHLTAEKLYVYLRTSCYYSWDCICGEPDFHGPRLTCPSCTKSREKYKKEFHEKYKYDLKTNKWIRI